MTDERLQAIHDQLDEVLKEMVVDLTEIQKGIADSGIADSVERYASGMLVYLDDITRLVDAIAIDAQGDETGEELTAHLQRSVRQLYCFAYSLSIVKSLAKDKLPELH